MAYVVYGCLEESLYNDLVNESQKKNDGNIYLKRLGVIIKK